MEKNVKVSPRILLQWAVAKARRQRALALPKESLTWKALLKVFKEDGAKYAAQDTCGVVEWLKRKGALDRALSVEEGRVELWFYPSQALLSQFAERDGRYIAKFITRGNKVTWEMGKGDKRAAALARMQLSRRIPAEMKGRIKRLGHGGGKYVYGCLYTDEKGGEDIEWHLMFAPAQAPATDVKKKLIGLVEAMPREEAAALLEYIQGKEAAASSPLAAPPAAGKSASPSVCPQSLFPNDGIL